MTGRLQACPSSRAAFSNLPDTIPVSLLTPHDRLPVTATLPNASSPKATTYGV